MLNAFLFFAMKRIWSSYGAFFLQVEARGRIAEGAAPDVCTAIQGGNSDAVELHMIADIEAVNMQNR